MRDEAARLPERVGESSLDSRKLDVTIKSEIDSVAELVSDVHQASENAGTSFVLLRRKARGLRRPRINVDAELTRRG